MGGKARTKLDDAVIEKRKPPFHRMRHSHPIALRRKQVLRQEDGALKILGSFERRPVLESGWILDRLDRVWSFPPSGLHYVRGKEACGAAIVAPPNCV